MLSIQTLECVIQPFKAAIDILCGQAHIELLQHPITDLDEDYRPKPLDGLATSIQYEWIETLAIDLEKVQPRRPCRCCPPR